MEYLVARLVHGGHHDLSAVGEAGEKAHESSGGEGIEAGRGLGRQKRREEEEEEEEGKERRKSVRRGTCRCGWMDAKT